MKVKVEYGRIDLFDIESLSAVQEYLERSGFNVEQKYDSVAYGGAYLCVYPENKKPQQEDPNA